MICIGHNQHAVLAPPITNYQMAGDVVFITLTDDDVENILNH